MKKIEITNITEIENIINTAQVCNLSMVEDGKPYCVPMNFGYIDGIIYFHGAPLGRKIDILTKDPNVCVSFYSEEALNVRHENVACSYSMKYKSVLAHGEVEFVENFDEKVRLLNIVMKKYSGRDDFTYSNPAIKGVNIFYLKPDSITAYKRGY